MFNAVLRPWRDPSRTWASLVYVFLDLFATSAVTFALAVTAWSGSLALVALPAYLGSPPGGEAHFGLFSTGTAAAAALACLVGVVGFVFVAPWLTLLVGRLDAALASWLLAPSKDLKAQVTKLEASRVAAVDIAAAERRRIERDLHDGAQQRLVSVHGPWSGSGTVR